MDSTGWEASSSHLAPPPIHAASERDTVTLMTSVMDHLDIVDLKTAKLGIAVIVIIAIQYIITGIAVIARQTMPNYAIVERDIVTLITSVLEILFVEQTTALLGILAWIAVPPLTVPLLLLGVDNSTVDSNWGIRGLYNGLLYHPCRYHYCSGWGTIPQWTAATGPRGSHCQVSLSVAIVVLVSGE